MKMAELKVEPGKSGGEADLLKLRCDSPHFYKTDSEVLIKAFSGD